MTHRNRGAGLATSFALLALLLTACAPATPPSKSPSSSPETPTDTVAPVAAGPTPRFDLGCADILPASTIDTLFSNPVTRQTAAQATEIFGQGNSYTYEVRSQGGLQCVWSNGKPYADASGANTSWQGATVTIFPDAAARWAWAQQYSGTTTNPQQTCYGAPANCSLVAFSSGFYVDIVLSNLKIVSTAKPGIDDHYAPPATVAHLFDDVRAKLAAVGPLKPAWTPPPGIATLPSTCNGFITAAQVQTALVVAGTVLLQGPDGGTPFAEDAPQLGCGFSPGGDERIYGLLNWLPGGAWAQPDMAATGTTPAARAIDVAGLGKGDSAHVGTGKDGEEYLDLVLDGNLIELRMSYPGASDGMPMPGVDQLTAAKKIAAQIVANLKAAG